MTLEGVATVFAIRLEVGAGSRWWSAQLIGVAINRLVSLSFAFLRMAARTGRSLPATRD